MVLRDNPAGTSLAAAKEAEQLLARAYNAARALQASGEGGESGDRYDPEAREQMNERELEEESFDLLVPGFFR